MIYSIQRFIRLIATFAIFAAHVAVPMVSQLVQRSSLVGKSAVGASRARALAGYRVLQNRSSSFRASKPQVQPGQAKAMVEPMASQVRDPIKSAFEPQLEQRKISKPKAPVIQQVQAKESVAASSPAQASQRSTMPWQLQRQQRFNPLFNPYLGQASFDEAPQAVVGAKKVQEPQARVKKQAKKPGVVKPTPSEIQPFGLAKSYIEQASAARSIERPLAVPKVTKSKKVKASEPQAAVPLERPEPIAKSEPVQPVIAAPEMALVLPEPSVASPEMALIPAQPLVVGAEISEPVQMAPSPASIIKKRIDYKQAMNVLDPFMQAVRALSRPHEANQNSALHNNLRKVILAAQKQGYAIGLVQKELVERMQSVPGAQSKLMLGDVASGNVILPEMALGIAGISQAPVLADIFGLQGEFIPFMVKNPQGKMPIPNAVLEVIQAAGNQNNPLAFDRSQIVMQPITPAIEGGNDADMRIANINNGPDAASEAGSGGGAGNGNGPERSAFEPQPGEEPGVQRAQPIPGEQNIPIDNGNPARALVGGMGDDEGSVEPVEPPYIEPDIVVPRPDEQPEAPERPFGGTGSGVPRKIQREQRPSDEEAAIVQFGSLILQALEKRLELQMLWAGNSNTLKAMFVAYNNLWTDNKKHNNQFTNRLYDISRLDIHVVVRTILASLLGN